MKKKKNTTWQEIKIVSLMFILVFIVFLIIEITDLFLLGLGLFTKSVTIALQSFQDPVMILLLSSIILWATIHLLSVLIELFSNVGGKLITAVMILKEKK